MHEAVGGAISAACLIEHKLYLLFTAIIEPKNVRALSAAFFTALAPNIKRDMVTAALLEHTDDAAIRKKWQSICDQITSCLGKRAELAHFTLITHIDDNNNKELFLEPDWLNVRAQQKNKGQRKRCHFVQKNLLL